MKLVKETRSKSAIFVTFILSEINFSNIRHSSQCIVYWINFQVIYTYILLLVVKIFESLQCILKGLWTLMKFVMNPLQPPESIRKPSGFLIFLGCIEKQHWKSFENPLSSIWIQLGINIVCFSLFKVYSRFLQVSSVLLQIVHSPVFCKLHLVVDLLQ